jgi:hypothetical protein
VLRSAIFMLRKFGWSSVRLIITAKWWGGADGRLRQESWMAGPSRGACLWDYYRS